MYVGYGWQVRERALNRRASAGDGGKQEKEYRVSRVALEKRQEARDKKRQRGKGEKKKARHPYANFEVEAHDQTKFLPRTEDKRGLGRVLGVVYYAAA